jgi:hypothetical protein
MSTFDNSGETAEQQIWIEMESGVSEDVQKREELIPNPAVILGCHYPEVDVGFGHSGAPRIQARESAPRKKFHTLMGHCPSHSHRIFSRPKAGKTCQSNPLRRKQMHIRKTVLSLAVLCLALAPLAFGTTCEPDTPLPFNPWLLRSGNRRIYADAS